MKLEVKCATSTQTAMPELNRPEKVMYYLIIGEGKNQVIINTGGKTYDKIKELELTTKPK